MWSSGALLCIRQAFPYYTNHSRVQIILSSSSSSLEKPANVFFFGVSLCQSTYTSGSRWFQICLHKHAPVLSLTFLHLNLMQIVYSCLVCPWTQIWCCELLLETDFIRVYLYDQVLDLGNCSWKLNSSGFFFWVWYFGLEFSNLDYFSFLWWIWCTRLQLKLKFILVCYLVDF